MHIDDDHLPTDTLNAVQLVAANSEWEEAARLLEVAESEVRTYLEFDLAAAQRAEGEELLLRIGLDRVIADSWRLDLETVEQLAPLRERLMAVKREVYLDGVTAVGEEPLRTSFADDDLPELRHPDIQARALASLGYLATRAAILGRTDTRSATEREADAAAERAMTDDERAKQRRAEIRAREEWRENRMSEARQYFREAMETPGANHDQLVHELVTDPALAFAFGWSLAYDETFELQNDSEPWLVAAIQKQETRVRGLTDVKELRAVRLEALRLKRGRWSKPTAEERALEAEIAEIQTHIDSWLVAQREASDVLDRVQVRKANRFDIEELMAEFAALRAQPPAQVIEWAGKALPRIPSNDDRFDVNRALIYRTRAESRFAIAAQPGIRNTPEGRTMVSEGRSDFGAAAGFFERLGNLGGTIENANYYKEAFLCYDSAGNRAKAQRMIDESQRVIKYLDYAKDFGDQNGELQQLNEIARSRGYTMRDMSK
ncbi:MAG: hypothetical protein ACOYNI_02980 [Acidimicrobiia bacterium]